MTVEFADEEPEGLTQLLGELIVQNLARDPSRIRLLRPGVAVIAAKDAGVATTLRFAAGSVRVETGDRGDAQVVVTAESRLLFRLIAAPLRAGFPDVLSDEGRAVSGAILRGDVRIRGLLLHPGLVRRLTMLLSAT